MKIAARFEGMDGLSATLSGIADAAGLGGVLEAAAADVRDAAAANLADGQPPDSRSGALAQSLAVTPGGDGLSFTVATPLDYGWHLEFGSLSHPATPWLAPAIDAALPSIERRLRDWRHDATRG